MSKKQNITLISSTLSSLSSFGGLKRLYSKKVYSKSGEYVGRIKEVLHSNFKITGIIVRRGMKEIFFDKEFFEITADEVLFLNIEPVVLLIGKDVFDLKGKQIGKVTNIRRTDSKNQFTSLVVKKNVISRPIEIKNSEIQTMKKNIILNVSISK